MISLGKLPDYIIFLHLDFFRFSLPTSYRHILRFVDFSLSFSLAFSHPSNMDQEGAHSAPIGAPAMPTRPASVYQPGSRRRSASQTRAEKIYEDIFNGAFVPLLLLMARTDNPRYECPICSDNVVNGSRMWSCGFCHHVYHFACMQVWVNSSRHQI